ncbi:sensor histidine kinase [Ruminococcus flavefaciens]|uniref:histidine kinase n=1 Tax=Ruminococcus flavefaciens TaxID=1265 RepID=A0A1K1LRB3_RUMFL|nr:HAMP domain-containing sensor histidine kinase [Ruminococcus flavefaciens]SFW13410.1 Signal transduction histidine kinase [Ruminococcus flavefaciens]
MRNLLRNSEILSSFTIYTVLSLITIVGAYLYDRKLALPALFVCTVFTVIHMNCIYIRYKRISKLSADIDRILHGEEDIQFENYSEGDIGLLQSEVYKMTVRLREQQSRLMEEKVSLADLLADISHQIRTPLTSINILVSMLSEPDLTYEKREQLVHKLYGLLSRIDWLITALLKMSKLDAGTIRFHSEDISMQELLDKACMPVRVPIELRGQELVIEAEGELSCDVAWSCEAIGNIVKNCMEHTPDSGTIKVCGKRNPLYSEIVISDSGSGISAEDLPHIFERFYKGRTSEDKGGFGIGLALARMIVTEQNGTLKAENAPDGGAMFTMRFYESTV